MLPERSDDEFKELMRKWRENKPYDPRKDLELTAPGTGEAVVRLRLARAALSTCS